MRFLKLTFHNGFLRQYVIGAMGQ